MKLHPLTVGDLKLSEAGQFIVRFFSDIDSLNLDLKKDPDMFAVYQTLQSQSKEYDLAMKQIKAMAESKELELLDIARDRKIITLRRVIETFEYSDDEKEQEAYHVATIIMKSYGHLEDENYEAETFDIKKLLEEWAKAENAKHAGVLGLEKHLVNLRKAACQFNELFSVRSAVTVQKVSYDSPALKKQMLDSYRKFVTYVAASIAVKKENGFYLKMLDAINNGRHYYADLLAKRQGGNNNDSAASQQAA